jgi:hypothetical protein
MDTETLPATLPRADIDAHDRGVASSAPFEHTLDDATDLLKYAAAAGVEVDAEVAQRIIAARAAGSAAWQGPEAGALMAAITKLAAKLRPVTAESLHACERAPHESIKSLRRITFILAAIIIPLSMVSFIFNALSESIATDLKTANDLVVALHVQLVAPATVPTAAASSSPAATLSPAAAGARPATRTETVIQLQQFAATIRAIYARAQQLNFFVFFMVADPFRDLDAAARRQRLELDPGLVDPLGETVGKTATFQDVRGFAKSAQEATSVIYGALAASFLPMLYGVLGACAYLLRDFSVQTQARTYVPSEAHSARFIMAGIGGAVVGLFNRFILDQGASLSPIALAFLVGYAADVFFAFLDGLLQSFTKTRST